MGKAITPVRLFVSLVALPATGSSRVGRATSAAPVVVVGTVAASGKGLSAAVKVPRGIACKARDIIDAASRPSSISVT